MSAPRPEALWFGHDRARSFAMVHRPNRPTGAGVVICNAFGFEGLLAHRPLRHLATALAEEGRTVVRLDYEGTGDAAGPQHGPDGLAPALDGIDDAVALLRDREGCTEISLVGIRAGALLACLYGMKHPGIHDLVLWGPVERGKTYGRELRAMHRLSAASRPGGPEPADANGALEVVGFEFAAATLADLAEVDLTAPLSAAPAEHVLILQRDDQPESDALLEGLQATGADVERKPSLHWADFMVDDETQSVLPQASLDTIAAWLTRDGAPDPVGPASTAIHDPAASLHVAPELAAAGYRERGVWIDERLFAIVSEPTDLAAGPRPLVVMPNTGSVNRTGPGRLYTLLARQWAELGCTVVRVDLGGTGDSTTAKGEPENQPYADARVRELLTVIDWGQEHLSARETTLFGICSGAYQSFQAALAGAPIRRAIMVNQAIYYLGPDQTVDSSTSKAMIASQNIWRLRFVTSQVARAVRSPQDLLQFARRAWRGVVASLGAAARRVLRRVGVRLPEREHLARDLANLASRDIDTIFVFAAGEPGLRYLHVFGGDSLHPRGGPAAATVIEIPGGDHVFSPPIARRAMTAAVTDHLVALDPASSSGPGRTGQG